MVGPLSAAASAAHAHLELVFGVRSLDFRHDVDERGALLGLHRLLQVVVHTYAFSEREVEGHVVSPANASCFGVLDGALPACWMGVHSFPARRNASA